MSRRELRKKLDIAMMFIAALAVISLIGKGGLSAEFRPFFNYLDVLIIIAFIVNAIFRLFAVPNWWGYIKAHPLQYILIALFISQLLITHLLLTDASFKYILNSLNLVGWTKIYIVIIPVSYTHLTLPTN